MSSQKSEIYLFKYQTVKTNQTINLTNKCYRQIFMYTSNFTSTYHILHHMWHIITSNIRNWIFSALIRFKYLVILDIVSQKKCMKYINSIRIHHDYEYCIGFIVYLIKKNQGTFFLFILKAKYIFPCDL